MCDQLGLTFIDTTQVFPDNCYGQDGIHPNRGGANVLADIITKVVGLQTPDGAVAPINKHNYSLDDNATPSTSHTEIEQSGSLPSFDGVQRAENETDGGPLTTCRSRNSNNS